MSAGQRIELGLPTQRSLWRFSGRLTAPPCQRPFAELVARIGFGYNGHSLVPTDDRDKIAAERPLQKYATSSSRPTTACR
jgi:hypothetical protein